jgi:hypothetical protein
MVKSNLLEEAVADAKAVRETALANAKAALEEAFTPKIQSMISAKLTEELDEELELEEEKAEEDVVEAKEESMDEISLEEILAELELDEAGDSELLESEDEDEEEVKEEVTEAKEEDAEESLNEEEMGLDLGDEELPEVPEEIDLSALLAALQDEELEAPALDDETEIDDLRMEVEKLNEKLNEAQKLIKIQDEKLNESKIFTAKLLYANKIFKNHDLNESQKTKVINSLDQANTKNEAKVVYNLLNETFTTVKETIKESAYRRPKSFASKASGTLINENKAPVVDENDTVSRWQKLANIK